MKLAVASKDGISINLHFGHAREFWIYQVVSAQVVSLERRQVDLYCHGNTGDQSAMQKILATISDCAAVFVAKIGEGPVAKLNAVGVQAREDYAYLGIADSLLDYNRKCMGSSP